MPLFGFIKQIEGMGFSFREFRQSLAWRQCDLEAFREVKKEIGMTTSQLLDVEKLKVEKAEKPPGTRRVR